MYDGTELDSFCGSKLWDANISWYTEDPDLTPCFQRTVLIWVPCAFLWAFSSLELFYLINSRDKNVPWNLFNLSKLVITCILGVVCIADFGYAVDLANTEDSVIFNVHYYSPFVLLASFCLAGVFLVFNRVRGMTASGLLFFFWLLLAICGAVQFRSELNRASTDVEYKSSYFFISYMVYYPLVIVQFFLNCFADKPPLFSEFPPAKNPWPELRSSTLSRLLFSWFDGMAWLGFRKPLEPSDLWTLNTEDTSEGVVPKFDKHWNKSVQSSAKKSAPLVGRASYQKRSGSVDIGGQTLEKKHGASILWPLCRAFGPTFIFGSLLKLVNDLLTFVNPHILELLIGYIKEGDSEWKGYLYAGLMLIVATLQTIVLSQYFYRMMIVGLHARTAIISAIYRKSLRLSNASRKESTVGEIVNLMSVDAQRFREVTSYLNMIWSAPLQIALALYFLWNLLGPSVLSGLAVMIILIPVNGVIANKTKVLQIRQMKNKDERVKVMNEVLSGIKVLKLYAWEPSFEQQILKIRGKEVQVLKEAAYLNAGSSFISSCAPFLVGLVTLATFVLLGNDLSPATAFVSLSYFHILRFPMMAIPMTISFFVQASVSMKRINKFLNCNELNPNDVTHEESDPNPLVIENGSFAWGPDEPPILKGINIQLKQGQLAAVVGSVGSGKSSLISALLGEMDKVNGRVNTKGSIAYVSQQAWIQNATLRENILFGKDLELSAYKRVVDACTLKPDLEMLPAGDQTEIGEKGINLSGGQKQRVSLARAVYASSDVYFLDDPLSAVDSHVGKHIFENVIGPSGILRHKTRLLVTHSITYLPEVDVIFVIKDGTISETGTYKELLERKGAFAEFLIAHLQENVDVADIVFEEIITQLEGAIGEETFRQLQRQRSETKSDSGSMGRRISESSSGQADVVGEILKSVDKDDGRKSSVNKDDSRKLSSTNVAKPAKDKLIEIEKANSGSVKWFVYSHYLRSVGIWLAFGTVLINMIYQGFSIGSNVWLSAWSDASANTVNGTIDNDTRNLYLGVYGLLGLGQVVTTLLASLYLYLGAVQAAAILHTHMLTNVLKSPVSFFDVTPLGRILNRFSRDVDILDNVLPMTLRGWVTCFFTVVATLVVISYTTPLFIAVILPIGCIYYFIQRFYVATSRQLKRIESVSRSPIYSHFGESITGAQTIRAYSVQHRFIKESEEKVDFNQVCFFPSVIANRWLTIRLEMVGNLIIIFAALFAVINRDTMNAGLVALSITYALQITQTLNWLVRMTSEVETNIVTVERIKEYGETPQEAPWDIPETKPPPEWPTKGEVEFRKYQVRYREGLELVLKGIDFCVRGGEKVGIVGRTGAGKSSLTLALFRIIEPAAGSIIIDGLDVSKMGLHNLRSRLTIIPQDPVLFSGTIRLNLDPFKYHTDQEVWQALEHAHLKSFVSQLNLGLEHEVTEGGENLSVGQRQQICLGRALLRKTKVLVMDEATAAIDLETDDLIQRTIRTEFKDCTVLTIAHRLNTIIDSDRVVVLDKGLVVEYDSPQILMSNPKSVFASMARVAGITMDKKET